MLCEKPSSTPWLLVRKESLDVGALWAVFRFVKYTDIRPFKSLKRNQLLTSLDPYFHQAGDSGNTVWLIL